MLDRRPILAAALLAASIMPNLAAAQTKPAVVWIPTAPVDVVPSGSQGTQCSKTGMAGSAVAAGCIPNLDAPTTLTPHPDAQDIADGVAAAFMAYDLRVVTQAPPEYLPTFAVFTSSDTVPEGISSTCSSSSANCAARARDRSSFTNTGTASCTDPNLVMTAVYAVGRMSGLEGKDAAPGDWMNYPPNFLSPPVGFLDGCGDIANQLGGRDGMTPLPLECTSLDHVGCAVGQQNSHADLLEHLGPAGGDGEAPGIDVLMPVDGAVLEFGSPIEVVYTLDEVSNFAGTRLTLSSPALAQFEQFEDGRITWCTSDLCDVNWLDNEPFKTADSEWGSNELHGFPEGDYLVSIEASDYYGNEADVVTLSISIGEGGVDPTGGMGETGADTGTPGGTSTTTGAGGVSEGGGVPPQTTAGSTGAEPGTGASEATGVGGSGSSGEAAAGDFADRGCSCRTTPVGSGPMGLLLGLLGLSLRRRR